MKAVQTGSAIHALVESDSIRVMKMWFHESYNHYDLIQIYQSIISGTGAASTAVVVA
jgi:hypothetical protein